MRVEHFLDGSTRLVLSRRNLRALLVKLDGNPPDSQCEINAPMQYGKFSVKAEEDNMHYHHPDRDAQGEAGAMIDATETLVSGEAGITEDGDGTATIPIGCACGDASSTHDGCPLD